MIITFIKTPHQFLVERELKKYAANKTNKKILEIGSGNSSYRKFFKSCSFLATDIKKFPGVDELADVTKLRYKPNSFDIVICVSVLEHVKDYQKAISEIFRVLKPGGETVVVVPFLFPLHDIPGDYWRFTGYALREIFKKFSDINIKPLIISRLFWRFVLDYFLVAKK